MTLVCRIGVFDISFMFQIALLELIVAHPFQTVQVPMPGGGFLMFVWNSVIWLGINRTF